MVLQAYNVSGMFLTSEHHRTPLHNDLLETWSLLHWLYPNVFTSKTRQQFETSFDLSKGCVCTSFLDKVKQLLKLIMLRRMKEDQEAGLKLPPKEDVLLSIPLTPLQKHLYSKLLTKSNDTIGIFSNASSGYEIKDNRTKKLNHSARAARIIYSSDEDGDHHRKGMKSQDNFFEDPSRSRMSYRALMNLVLQLRKCCIHPRILSDAYDHLASEKGVMPESGKFIVLQKLLLDIIGRKGEKVLIFSGFKGVLDLCEDLLEENRTKGMRNMTCLRLDGDTGRARRNLHIRLFQTTDVPVMLLSIRAGGLGITLTAANNVIFLDEDWNPQLTLQAEARAHRVGQTKPVTVYKLCTQGTVEEQMRGRIQKKLYLSARVTAKEAGPELYKIVPSETASSSTDRKKSNPGPNEAQLRNIVRKGAQALMHQSIDIHELLSWDLETAIQKCTSSVKESDSEEVDDNDDTLTKADEEKWLSSTERVRCGFFEGKRRYRAQENHDNNSEEEIPDGQRRKRTKLTTKMDGFYVMKSLCARDEGREESSLSPQSSPTVAEPSKAIFEHKKVRFSFDLIRI